MYSPIRSAQCIWIGVTQINKFTLLQRHVPTEFIDIFSDIYSNSYVSVAVNDSWTDAIKVERGVLQGDPASPLLFNMCMNTFINTISQAHIQQLGVSWGTKSSKLVRSWLQYADDPAVTSTDIKSLQQLLNLFQTWCICSKFEIRVDKCIAFAMQKRDGVYKQYLPSLNINNTIILNVPIGGNFTYYTFDCDNNEIKKTISKKLNNMLQITDKLKIRPQDKIKIVTQYIHSQLSFHIKLYDFPLTWIENTLDAACFKYIRKWLELPISACLTEVFVLNRAKCGLGQNSFKSLAKKLKLIKRNAIRNSGSNDIREIWINTQNKSVNLDCLLISSKYIRAANKELAEQQSNEALRHLKSLSVQGAVINSIIDTVATRDISLWASILQQSSTIVYNFARKAIIQVLPTAANLVRWGRIQDPNCPLCNKLQTNKHVLSNCSAPVALERYKQRHDKVLNVIVSWIRSVASPVQTVYSDIPGDSKEVSDLFSGYRPDIAIVNSSSISTLELTVCHETNLVSSKQYKINKYKDLSNFTNVICNHKSISCFTIEVTSLGFISCINDFIKLNKLPAMPSAVKKNIIESVLNSSLNIYFNRNVAY